MRYRVSTLETEGALLIQSDAFHDERGSFEELYRRSLFMGLGVEDEFVQDNRSLSCKGALRGLHFQRPPSVQAKLVRVGRGRIIDVGLDLRPQSPTYTRYFAISMNPSSGLLYIPGGYAHGFLALDDDTEVLYRASAEYDPTAEAGVQALDPDLGIPWPQMARILRSPRDQALPPLAELDLPNW